MALHNWDQRRSPRIDVLMRVQGRLLAVDKPVVVHDLSHTGFAVVSEMSFERGQTLDFRLAANDSIVEVTAQAIHSRSMPFTPGLHLSGFMFVPGRLTGLVPHASIDKLIATLSVHVPLL